MEQQHVGRMDDEEQRGRGAGGRDGRRAAGAFQPGGQADQGGTVAVKMTVFKA